MNATTKYNRIAEQINKACKASVVSTCQIPQESHLREYFKEGVALYFDDLDNFNHVMRNFSDFTIEDGDKSYYLEPWDTTYVGVWED